MQRSVPSSADARVARVCNMNPKSEPIRDDGDPTVQIGATISPSEATECGGELPSGSERIPEGNFNPADLA